MCLPNGSTISIGGEEKKMKITETFSTWSIDGGSAVEHTQGTEDATKWNECLAPVAFVLTHIYFFNNNIRRKLGSHIALNGVNYSLALQ